MMARFATTMREMSRSATLWVGLVLIVGYWPVSWYVPADPQLEFENAFRLAIGIVVVCAYTPGVISALRMRTPTYGHQLVLGIFLAWSGSVGTSGWTLAWRLAGKPVWMLQSNLAGWFLWLSILGGVLHVTAKRVIEDDIPRTDWRQLWVAFGLGVILGSIAVAVRPDMRPFMEWLRPLLDDGF